MKQIEKIKAEIERLKSKCPDSEWQLKVAMNKLIDSLEKEEEKSNELTPGDIHLILIAKEEIENENPELMVKSDTSLFDAILERYLELKKEI